MQGKCALRQIQLPSAVSAGATECLLCFAAIVLGWADQKVGLAGLMSWLMLNYFGGRQGCGFLRWSALILSGILKV